MLKKLIIGSILMMFLVIPAQATPPSGGWGTDLGNWQIPSVPVTTNDLIYDPVAGFYRDVVTGNEVIWPEFQIDLWIELEIVIHFDWSQFEIHRVSLYDPIEIIIPGLIKQNSGNWLIFGAIGNDPNGNPYWSDSMNFIHDIFDRTGSDYGSGIPVSWWWSNGIVPGVWEPMVLNASTTPPSYMFLMEDACDQYFFVKILIDVAYHTEDGFYKMHGDLCPLPVL